MTRHTKNNPGCIHDMQEFMSELSGIPLFKEEEIPLDKLPSMNNKKLNHVQFYLNGQCLGEMRIEQRKGGISVYSNVRAHAPINAPRGDYPMDTQWDKMVLRTRRTIQDFDIPFESAGKYNECLGGGWNSKVSMYKVKGRMNDHYFANMSCSC